MPQHPAPRRPHLLLAAACVAAGALSAIWGPHGLLGLVVMIGLMRICWLEDNIANDLIGQEKLPRGYVNTVIRRRNFLWYWFRLRPGEDVTENSPLQLATGMRAEIQVWACLLLGYGSTVFAQFGPVPGWGNLGLGAGLFLLALRRADTLAVTLAHCAQRRVLPRERLMPRQRWAMVRRDRG